jgi:hypothetical protein
LENLESGFVGLVAERGCWEFGFDFVDGIWRLGLVWVSSLFLFVLERRDGIRLKDKTGRI